MWLVTSPGLPDWPRIVSLATPRPPGRRAGNAHIISRFLLIKYVLKMVHFGNCDELFEIVTKIPSLKFVVGCSSGSARHQFERDCSGWGGGSLCCIVEPCFAAIFQPYFISIGSAVSSAFRLVRCNPPSPALVSMRRVLLRQQTPRQLQRTGHRQHQQSAQPRHHLQWNTTWTWSSAWMR